jgi:cytoskeletal protein RodZ
MDDFGGKLRQARERRGISLRQIAASTKIAAAALEALERNDISKLPGGIFSRAFVRSYAIEVGLDPDDTVREFLERFNQDPPPTAETAVDIPEEEREFQERQRKAARIVIGSTIGLVVLAVALVVAYRARNAARARAESQVVQAAPPAQEPPPQVTPAPGPDPAAPVSAASGAADSGRPSGPPPPAAGQVRLDIHPVGDCWVSLTADGKKVFARVVTAGEKQTVTIAREATVEVGDAGAFDYDVNGKPGKPLGIKGQVKTLKLTPATAAQYIR